MSKHIRDSPKRQKRDASKEREPKEQDRDDVKDSKCPNDEEKRSRDTHNEKRRRSERNDEGRRNKDEDRSKRNEEDVKKNEDGGNRSRERANRSRDRGNRSRDRGNRSRDRGNRSRDRGNRSQDRDSRSQDRANRSQDRANRSQDRANRSQERSSRSEEKGTRSDEKGTRNEEKGIRRTEKDIQGEEKETRSEEKDNKSEEKDNRSEKKVHNSDEKRTRSEEKGNKSEDRSVMNQDRITENDQRNRNADRDKRKDDRGNKNEDRSKRYVDKDTKNENRGNRKDNKNNRNDEKDSRKDDRSNRTEDRRKRSYSKERNTQERFKRTKRNGDDPVIDSRTESNNEVAKKVSSKTDTGSLMTRTGGAYIHPARLRLMQAEIADKSSAEYQRISWEALKKSIHGLINKVNISNISIIVRELFQENVVRGRGLLARSIMQAQSFSPTFSHVYSGLIGIINSKFPLSGELILKRLIIQFRRGFKRNDKQVCLTSTRFVAHLVNQQVAHEVVALEILTLLLENPTDDAVEVAVGFLKECGLKLTEVSPRGIHAIFERLRSILHEGHLDKRVQYMIEVMFAVRKDGFKDFPSVVKDLDLTDETDQFTHLLSLDEAVDPDDMLNIFKLDPEFEVNEEKYKSIKKEILDEVSSGSENSNSDESDDEDDNDQNGAEGEGENAQLILDNTETNLIALRRIIYLTIQSSLDFEECAHKLLKLEFQPGQIVELCHMILDCCAQQRTYEKFYGLLAQRFCQINKIYIDPFQEIFCTSYDTIHRFETNKLRNVAKFFAHLLHTDAISWLVLSRIHLNEDETTSSSRIFIKILFQELCEYMGLPKLNERVKDITLQEGFDGLFPRDNPRNTRFAINFFTSIGLGGLTDDLREHLKVMPKINPLAASIVPPTPVPVVEIPEVVAASPQKSTSDEDGSSESSSSESDEKRQKKQKKKTKKKNKKKSKKPANDDKENRHAKKKSKRKTEKNGSKTRLEAEHQERYSQNNTIQEALSDSQDSQDEDEEDQMNLPMRSRVSRPVVQRNNAPANEAPANERKNLSDDARTRTIRRRPHSKDSSASPPASPPPVQHEKKRTRPSPVQPSAAQPFDGANKRQRPSRDSNEREERPRRKSPTPPRAYRDFDNDKQSYQQNRVWQNSGQQSRGRRNSSPVIHNRPRRVDSSNSPPPKQNRPRHNDNSNSPPPIKHTRPRRGESSNSPPSIKHTRPRRDESSNSPPAMQNRQRRNDSSSSPQPVQNRPRRNESPINYRRRERSVSPRHRKR